MNKLRIRREIAKKVKETVEGFMPALTEEVESETVLAQVKHVKDPLLEKLQTSIGE